MPIKYADLEIGLSRSDDTSYTVSFRLLRPESDDTLVERGKIMRETLNPDDFKDALADPADYGKRLTECFFGNPDITRWYTTYKSMVLAQGEMGLRVRLFIGPDAPELQRIHWELLCEPGSNSPIATSQHLLFSRYLSSTDVRPSLLKSRDEMKALVVIVNPSDLGTGKLPAPIDGKGELERARAGLADIPVTVFPEPESGERATLNNIITKCKDKEFDILYLVCHGSFNSTNEPILLLEDEDGKSKRTSGRDFAVRMKELLHRPKLIVLASCESAGTETGNALSAFGPLLVEDAGVPAVLAMQGKISMKTVEQFMPVFFHELQEQGYIDQALAVARGMVRGNHDFWMPVLFMRLVSGRLWYVPGYAETNDFDLWDVLTTQLNFQKMTPIIGPGVFQALLGSMRDIAESWAHKFNYPLASYERDSLAKVAQYLYGIKTKMVVFQHLQDSLRTDIQQDFANILPETLRTSNKATAGELISAIGAERRKNNKTDAYRILAKLPVKVYITTNLNGLLTDALVEAGKTPKVMICPWNRYTERKYKQVENFEPDVDHPLIFHMFGRLEEPDSLVLTEDDYFDFLLGYSRNAAIMPGPVIEALADSAWLFLGFQMEDWGFRVLFRSILSREGGGASDDIKHVAAQFVPEEGRIIDSDGAQRYLQKYFGKKPPINLYWGSAEEFLKELARHMDPQTA
ncbi:MAG TPA: CHAT domain-containing protein [Anaerolineales bacterium]|nr:CHAT domain-containing protein [Anaerolineales bacterium]